MTIDESGIYIRGTAVAVLIAVMVFDKLRGWFWDRYDEYKRLHRHRTDR